MKSMKRYLLFGAAGAALVLAVLSTVTTQTAVAEPANTVPGHYEATFDGGWHN
jgi:hypothetical protein